MNLGSVWNGWGLGEPVKYADDTPGDLVRAAQRKNEKHKIKKSVIERVYLIDPRLVNGVKGIQVVDSKIEDLIDWIAKEHSGAAHKIAHNFLSRGLDKGCRDLGWDVSVPSPMVTKAREENPFTIKSYKLLSEYDELMDKHEKAGLAQSTEFRSPGWAFGRFAFCLITEGALLNKYWIKKLSEAVSNGVGVLDEKIYLTLEGSITEKHKNSLTALESSLNNEPKNDQKIYRRLFPGPTSSLALLSYYKKMSGTHHLNKSVYQCLQEYVQDLDKRISMSQEKLLETLISYGVAAASHTLPGYLVHYSKSKNVSISLDPSGWHRLMTGKIDSSLEKKGDDDSTEPFYNPGISIGKKSLHTGAANTDQTQRFTELYDLLKTDSYAGSSGRKYVKDNIHNFLSSSHLNSPIIQAIGHWTYHLLINGSVQKSKISISTIKNYIGKSGINGRLLTSLASQHEDLSSLGHEEWANIYENILSKSSSDHNYNIKSWSLSQFHEFLMEKFEDIPPLEIGSSARQETRVDNNIITPAEYKRSLDIIVKSDQAFRFKEIQHIALILGYRCGLRRGEIRNLKIADVNQNLSETMSNMESWIHNGKSESATRRIPMDPFLSKNEMEKVVYWLDKRHSETGYKALGKELFLCLPGQDHRPLSDMELFLPITKALKIASGMPNARFHHLRHSSVTFAHAHIDNPGNGRPLPKKFVTDDNGECAIPYYHHDLSSALGMAKSKQTCRGRIWLISSYHGHISPAETLRSYSHLTDLILGNHLWESDDLALPQDQQAALLGLSRESLPVWRSRKKIKGETTSKELIAGLGKEVWRPYLEPPPEGHWETFPLTKVNNIATPMIKLISPLFVYRILASIEREEAIGKSLRQSVLAIAYRFQMPDIVIDQWVIKASSLMEMTTSRRNGRQRYGKQRVKNPLTGDKIIRAYLPEIKRCLAPPRSPEHQKESNTFFHKIIEWYLEDPEQCYDSLEIFHSAIQRSAGQVNFRDKRHLGPALKMCEKLQIMSYAKLFVEIPSGANPAEAQAYWSQLLEIKRSQVKCMIRENDQPTRDPNGLANLRLYYEKSQEELKYTLWPCLRFAIFTAGVVIESDLLEKMTSEQSL
ncbi:tyrosine-type recombinase/integrase [Halomonas sp. PBN3]|uniref:tyrosine-type recombinase/integrase n=1 Tax=Halomonas sp. PBN3 TaxID=1397528 RepID=UPI0004B82828|nr:tyrosine-type recombinase/integrase [Halomonas sp. PBN3]